MSDNNDSNFSKKRPWLDDRGRLRTIKSNLDKIGSDNVSQAIFKYESDEPAPIIPEPNYCIYHEWTFYQGFNHDYWFCKHCDLKKDKI